jgi:hypothetical protein
MGNREQWEAIVKARVTQWHVLPNEKRRPRFVKLTLWQKLRAWWAGLL